MKNEKIQIEINNHPYNKDTIYAAICMRGGFITRNFIIDDSHFVSNCAFYNILFNYYRVSDAFLGLHYDVQRSASTISFIKNKSEFLPFLKNVVNYLLNYEYNSDIFNIAKQKAKDAFSTLYKDCAFRAKYKGYEFSDLNKRFTLSQLLNDITQITFEDFITIAKTLIVPGNICIYVVGEADKLDFSSLSLIDCAAPSSKVRIAGYKFDPYLRQDAHIANIAREDHNLSIVALDFINKNCTNFTKLIITELLAEQLPLHAVDVWVDSLDASIMFSSDELRGYKSLLKIDNIKSFDAAHKKLLIKYASLMANSPEHFAIKAAHMMSVGIYIDQYLDFLDKCSFEQFVELINMSDPKITEAQIVFRKDTV